MDLTRRGGSEGAGGGGGGAGGRGRAGDWDSGNCECTVLQPAGGSDGTGLRGLDKYDDISMINIYISVCINNLFTVFTYA